MCSLLLPIELHVARLTLWLAKNGMLDYQPSCIECLTTSLSWQPSVLQCLVDNAWQPSVLQLDYQSGSQFKFSVEYLATRQVVELLKKEGFHEGVVQLFVEAMRQSWCRKLTNKIIQRKLGLQKSKILKTKFYLKYNGANNKEIPPANPHKKESEKIIFNSYVQFTVYYF